jgi:hypothetical protein
MRQDTALSKGFPTPPEPNPERVWLANSGAPSRRQCRLQALLSLL